MKKRMPKRAALNKLSSFLSSTKRKYQTHSIIRFTRKKNNLEPNSTKIGRGKVVVARRDLPEDTIHRRDYRSTRMIGVTYGARIDIV